jgi:putative hydrolases of HD superfamily
MAIRKKSRQLKESGNLVKVFFELAGLSVIPRSGLIQYCFENFETIAAHSHKVAFISYFLAIKLKADVGKVLTMAIFHDGTETRVGDSNYPQKKYIDRKESLAVTDQYSDLKVEEKEGLLKIIKDYEAKLSLEARIVKDADYLAFYIVAKQLELKGNQEAKFRIDLAKKKIDFLYLEESKKLLVEILNADPNSWTYPLLFETFKKKAYK